jgi:prepilin-type N-terminal cleavage/methylation domain-containing protein
MITLTDDRKDNKGVSAGAGGFTLLELMIVLAVISAVVGVTLPYASRSNHVLSIRQDGLNIAQAFQYGIDIAESRNNKVKITLDPVERSYQLLTENQDGWYEPLEGYFGIARRFSQDVSLDNVEGLTRAGDEWQFIIDPAEIFAEADFELRAKEIIIKIVISGRGVKVEETGI